MIEVGILCVLFGWIAGNVWNNIITNKKQSTFEQYRNSAMEDLTKFQQQVHSELYKANEQFAKQNISRLLLEALTDILKEKQQ